MVRLLFLIQLHIILQTLNRIILLHLVLSSFA
jgi:hypothetical protein